MLSDRSARNFFNQDKTTIAGIIFVQKRAIAPTFYLVKVNSLTSYLLSLVVFIFTFDYPLSHYLLTIWVYVNYIGIKYLVVLKNKNKN